MTLVYLKLLKHATHHLKRSLSRDTWFCTFAHANVADEAGLINQGSFRVNEVPRMQLAMESNMQWYRVTKLPFLLHKHVRDKSSYAEIQWWGFLVPFSSGAGMPWLPPWRIGEKITQKGLVTSAGLDLSPLRVADPQAVLLWWANQKGWWKPEGLSWFGWPWRLGKCETGQLAAPMFHKSHLPKYSISVSHEKTPSVHPAASAASAEELGVSHCSLQSLWWYLCTARCIFIITLTQSSKTLALYQKARLTTAIIYQLSCCTLAFASLSLHPSSEIVFPFLTLFQLSQRIQKVHCFVTKPGKTSKNETLYYYKTSKAFSDRCVFVYVC